MFSSSARSATQTTTTGSDALKYKEDKRSIHIECNIVWRDQKIDGNKAGTHVFFNKIL